MRGWPFTQPWLNSPLSSLAAGTFILNHFGRFFFDFGFVPSYNKSVAEFHVIPVRPD
jgi:hypothetical protein